MSILEYFDDWKNQTMRVQEKTYTYNEGKISSEAWSDVSGLASVPCWLYTGSSSSSYISDRLKDSVSAVIIVDPSDLGGIPLKDTMRGIIDSAPYYFLDPDDIMNLDEVIAIPVNEEDK
jgi:hypothetical protein